MRKTKLASILLIVSVLLLSACGQKGALYIPADTATNAVPEMSENPAKEAAKKKVAE